MNAENKPRKFRFLLAWITGSDANCGEKNAINDQYDLVRFYEEYEDLTGEFGGFYSDEYELSGAACGYAWEIGAAGAFIEDFTAHDSTSAVQEWVNGEWLTVFCGDMCRAEAGKFKPVFDFV